MALIEEARQAGLRVALERGQLVVSGPRRLESLAKRLLARREAVTLALEIEGFRGGSDPDWRGWSPACRAAWARCAAEIAQANNFWSDLSEDDRQWVQSTFAS